MSENDSTRANKKILASSRNNPKSSKNNPTEKLVEKEAEGPKNESEGVNDNKKIAKSPKDSSSPKSGIKLKAIAKLTSTISSPTRGKKKVKSIPKMCTLRLMKREKDDIALPTIFRKGNGEDSKKKNGGAKPCEKDGRGGRSPGRSPPTSPKGRSPGGGGSPLGSPGRGRKGLLPRSLPLNQRTATKVGSLGGANLQSSSRVEECKILIPQNYLQLQQRFAQKFQKRGQIDHDTVMIVTINGRTFFPNKFPRIQTTDVITFREFRPRKLDFGGWGGLELQTKKYGSKGRGAWYEKEYEERITNRKANCVRLK